MLRQCLQRLRRNPQQSTGILGVIHRRQRLKAQKPGAKLLQAATALGGIQQIGRQGGIKARQRRGQIAFHQGPHHRLCLMQHWCGIPAKQRLQQLVPTGSAYGFFLHQQGLSLCRHRQRRQVSHQAQRRALGRRFCQIFCLSSRQFPHGRQFHRHRVGIRFGRGRQFQTLDKRPQFYPGQEPIQLVPLHRRRCQLTGSFLQRRIGNAHGQLIAEEGHVPAFLQLFLHRRTDGGIFQIGIDVFQGAEAQQQLHGALFTNALDTGNVVGCIAHDRLQVYDAAGSQPLIGGAEGFLIEDFGAGAAHAGDNQRHLRALIDVLQTVTVTGDNGAGIALLPAAAGQGAQQVIGLKALLLQSGDAQQIQSLLHQRHLRRQLLRHRLTLGFIALVGQMPEGFGPQVKTNANFVGLQVLPQLQQHIQKSV